MCIGEKIPVPKISLKSKPLNAGFYCSHLENASSPKPLNIKLIP